MLPVTLIPRVETTEWLNDSPKVKEYATQAYKECIPTILNPVTMDYRFCLNSHLVNVGFIEEPVFLVGYKDIGHLALSVLYVYPKYRYQGLATFLLRDIQVKTNGVIQVAVESHRKSDLGRLYEGVGFRTLGNEATDDLGTSYIDYFWSPRPFRLTQLPGGTGIEPE